MVWGRCLLAFLRMWISSCFSTICLQKLIDHKCRTYFWSFSSNQLINKSIFMSVPNWFDYSSLVSFEIILLFNIKYHNTYDCHFKIYIFLLKIFLNVFLALRVFLSVLDFSSCGRRSLLFSYSAQLLSAVASLVTEHSARARLLFSGCLHVGSAVAAQGL